MSATTSRTTRSGASSATCIAVFPPIECPSTAAVPTPAASSVSSTSAAMAG